MFSLVAQLIQITEQYGQAVSFINGELFEHMQSVIGSKVMSKQSIKYSRLDL